MPDDKKVERTACWIDKDIVRKAKEIAAREDSTISEVVERLLRSPILRRHDKLFTPVELGESGGG